LDHKGTSLRQAYGWQAPAQMNFREVVAGFLAAKERKEHKDNPFRPLFFAIYAFFRGYTSGQTDVGSLF